MKKYYGLISLVIIALSLVLRLYHFSARSPFDWDQNRDYQAIAQIAGGKPTLIGPVAKGEGGFFLGPLYYYLATPAFVLMQGSPHALPLTSMLIDVFTVVAIVTLLRSRLGDQQTLILATLWSASWFAIELSRISWNVALVPLYSVLMLWFLSDKSSLSSTKVVLLGITAGLSWHVHAALIPLTLVLLVASWRRWASSPAHVGLLVLGYLIPLIPLFLFDLRHAGLNWYLLTQMLSKGGQSGIPYTTMLEALLLRLGKNTQYLLTGSGGYQLMLGILTAVLGLSALIRGRGLYRVAGLIMTLNILAVIALRETGFPEYYLSVSYLPTLILVVAALTRLTKPVPVLLLILLSLTLTQNVRHYSRDETPFALSRKERLAHDLRELDKPIDLRFDLAPGREGGIIPLFRQAGGVIDRESALKIVVSDKGDGPLLIEGELASTIGHYGGMRSAKVVVE